MAISQISTSNTFAQWLAATQSLIDKQNYVEGNVNTVIAAAESTTNVYNNTVSVYNNTFAVFSDTSNTYANTVIVYNDTVNVYSNIVSYVSTAYDTANAANLVANTANTTAYQALQVATAANNIVNNVNIVALEFKVNSAYDTANAASNTAQAAFNKANTFSQNTFVKISVFGQSDINANSNSTILTIASGANVTLTTDNVTNTLTIDSVGGSTATGDVNPTPNTVVQRNASGDAYANNFISSSDARLKENVHPIENAVNIVSQLEGVHFTWKDTGAEQIGLIAQEVEKVIPQIVYGTDPKSINYPVMVAVLIQAIKELNERVKTLENK